MSATTVFVKDSRYDKMMEAFGGVGVHVTTPDELKRAVNEAMDSGKPTLINAVIDPAAGSESGRIGNLNPQSKIRKKYAKHDRRTRCNTKRCTADRGSQQGNGRDGPGSAAHTLLRYVLCSAGMRKS